MDKLVIFNVGGGMASYCELGGKKIIIDLGSSEDFSPVLDFLIPYAKLCGWEKVEGKTENGNTKFEGKKYIIDQLIISHPHKDHVSDIENFDKDFYAELITTPNDNDGMDEESLNWDLVFGDKEKDDKVVYLKENMIKGRTPPLQSSTKRLELYYIKPKIVEDEITPQSDYTNNVSLVCIIYVNGRKIMLPGDIMKSGSERMLNNNVINIVPGTKTETVFKNAIKKVNILVAPHHGLKSAYNSDIMNEMEEYLELVIIPEDVSKEDSTRVIDKRYYDGKYGCGVDITDIDSDSVNEQSTFKTSTGHIVISFDSVYKTKDTDTLIDLFSNL